MIIETDEFNDACQGGEIDTYTVGCLECFDHDITDGDPNGLTCQEMADLAGCDTVMDEENGWTLATFCQCTCKDHGGNHQQDFKNILWMFTLFIGKETYMKSFFYFIVLQGCKALRPPGPRSR